MTRRITFKYALLAVLASLFLTTSARAGFLYTLNSNQGIYGYEVNETTGALTPLLAGFPVATGSNGELFPASEALTIDRTNNRLYALNVGAKTVSAYSINATTGALTALPFSPIALPAPIGNAFTIAVHPSGSPLIVGGYEACASYNITATTATAAAGSPFSSGSYPWPSTSVFSLDGNYFYTGGIPLIYYPNGPSYFVGFSVNQATGVLTLLPGSPFDSGNLGAIGFVTDAQGRLFMANVDTSVVRAFTTSSGVPSGVSGNPFYGNTITPSDGVLHPNGNFYVVTDYLQYVINSHQIAGSGSATTMNLVSEVNTIGGLVSLVFNQEGTFLYGASDDSLRIMTYSFNPTTGALAFSNAQPLSTNGTSGYLVGIDYLPSPPADSTPPVITPTISGTLGNFDWYVSNVSVAWSVTDGESSVSTQTGCGLQTVTSDTNGVTFSCSATSGGGTASQSVTLKRDATKPTLAPTVSPNPVSLNGTAIAAANATDALSGLATQSCGAVNTASVGNKTVGCTATDLAGNAANANASYQVVYNFISFFSPVDNPPSLNKATAGSSIPVKFSLGGNQGLAIFAAGYPASQSINCSSGTPTSAMTLTVNPGGSSLSYDATSKQYNYVWKTDKAWKGTCRKLLLKFKDGTTRFALFQFK